MAVAEPAPRTLLEQLIRQRRQTLEEFSADAERFGIDHDLHATLSPTAIKTARFMPFWAELILRW
jgi:hypothetical protein